MNFIIREARSQDYTEISAIMREAQLIHDHLNIINQYENPMLKNKQHNLLKVNETKIFVVENCVTNELLAYSQVKVIQTLSHNAMITNKYVCINDFCVRSKDKKNGIGKLLFKQITEYAKLAGTSSLVLFEWIYNQDAVEFYPSNCLNSNNSHIEFLL